MNQSEPAADKTPKNIKSIWLDITNVCDRGKFKVYISINHDQEKHIKELFHGYPDQNDGIVSQGHSLQWIFDAGFAEAVRMLRSEEAPRNASSFYPYNDFWADWLEQQRSKE